MSEITGRLADQIVQNRTAEPRAAH
jgi:hypothetical protein